MIMRTLQEAKEIVFAKLGKERLDAILTFYNTYKDDILNIHIGGSNALYYYIDSPHDVDIILVLKKANSSKVPIHLSKEFLQERTKLCKLNHYAESVTHCCYLTGYNDFKFNETSPKFIDYPAYYFEPIILCGEPFPEKIDYNILEHKQESIRALEIWLSQIGAIYKKRQCIVKGLYLLALELFILKNNSYELTKDQLVTINLIHDSNDTELLIKEYKKLLPLVAELKNNYAS